MSKHENKPLTAVRKIEELLKYPFRGIELSEMEWEVVRLLSHGQTKANAAKRLRLSSGYVSSISARISKKVGIKPSSWPAILITHIEAAVKEALE